MELSGTVKNIIYRSDSNGFSVIELSDEAGGDITVTGTLPLIAVGEMVLLEGDYAEHPTYGPQFQARSYESTAPATAQALVNYLGSGLIRGVGESTARAIVQAFGLDALHVLEHQPHRLTEVVGIGAQRARTIADSFREQAQMRDTILKLQAIHVRPAHAVKLYQLFGPLCLAKIEENPYFLCEHIQHIGFATADQIALSMGMDQDAPQRLAAGLRYMLQWAWREGNTYLPRPSLLQASAQALGVSGESLEEVLDTLLYEGKFLRRDIGGVEGIFLDYAFYMENAAAQRLCALAATTCNNEADGLEDQLQDLERGMEMELAPQQREAVLTGVRRGGLVITGGPGTGKTTILRFILQLQERRGRKVCLCAPTGRAAKRMGEATGKEASTIHRLLEYGYDGEEFGRDEGNPVDADAVIADEMSMVDIPLLHALLRALAPTAQLIMVGDADQLPPVGPGNALRDIIAADVLPVVRLTTVFRQAQQSLIVTNAHRVNGGRMPLLDQPDSDFRFEPIGPVDQIARRVTGLITGKVKGLDTQDPFRDVQVLAPMKKGPLGVHALNAQLQQALNPPSRDKRERKFLDALLREGDKVMQTQNNYRLEWTRALPNGTRESGTGVYNGDIGTVMDIDSDGQTVCILFDDGREAHYDFAMMDEISLAYCLSIHKSQGSEFPVVLLPLAMGPPMLLNRNLLYTAITRARRQVYIVGREHCIRQMVDNQRTRQRYSGLRTALCECLEAAP